MVRHLLSDVTMIKGNNLEENTSYVFPRTEPDLYYVKEVSCLHCFAVMLLTNKGMYFI